MSKWFDANGTDVDAYPDQAFRGGVYEPRRFVACSHSYCTEPARPGDDRCAGHDRALLAAVERGDLEWYRLPDGGIVACDATATKHAPVINFTLKGGQIVKATRVEGLGR